MAVHQLCYGISIIPEGPWLCAKCACCIQGSSMLASRRDARLHGCVCCICGGQSAPRDAATKPTTCGRWAHVACALHFPGTAFGDPFTRSPITSVLRIPIANFKMPCSLCKRQEGACVPCTSPGCKQAFHVQCALTDNAARAVSECSHLYRDSPQKQVPYRTTFLETSSANHRSTRISYSQQEQRWMFVCGSHHTSSQHPALVFPRAHSSVPVVAVGDKKGAHAGSSTLPAFANDIVHSSKVAGVPKGIAATATTTTPDDTRIGRGSRVSVAYQMEKRSKGKPAKVTDEWFDGVVQSRAGTTRNYIDWWRIRFDDGSVDVRLLNTSTSPHWRLLTPTSTPVRPMKESLALLPGRSKPSRPSRSSGPETSSCHDEFEAAMVVAAAVSTLGADTKRCRQPQKQGRGRSKKEGRKDAKRGAVSALLQPTRTRCQIQAEASPLSLISASQNLARTTEKGGTTFEIDESFLIFESAET